MKILYLSCHSILEYDEVKLLTELGHEVFSVNGSYSNPQNPIDPKRPGIQAKFQEQLSAVALQSSKENLHAELIDWCDIVIVMHKPEWVIANWSKLQNKIVIWRSIGQSTPDIETKLLYSRKLDMRIVRYSPNEEKIPGYIGHDAIIRFYKDPEEFNHWQGETLKVVTVAQSMRKRGKFCGYEIFKAATENLPRVLFGPGNEDSSMNGGVLSYAKLRQVYRDYRVYFYTGTYPASYTLNFIEAFMTGIPVVAIGRNLANLNLFGFDAYEVPEFIQNGVNGFVSDDISELRKYASYLLTKPKEAKEIGERGKRKALELFGKENIKNKWMDYLNSL